MNKRKFKKHKNAEAVANDVMKNGILLGCHHGLLLEDLNYICNTFKRLLK